ncbi:hypothetical protein [Novosphingobium sp.]|uniref:hypothetical protein n=1 Tax=Novosphingobium sp. TaxID=1874826 RepID=UPI0025EB0E94|nr:hypothetical protein [Novosphingobium sp.]
MDESQTARVPASYWVISVLGALWNSFGAMDYVMTRMRNVDYLKAAGDPQVILSWIDSFPLWVQAAWGFGVWGSVAGSVLMLLRSRHAATAFLVSLAGAVGSFAYQYTHTPAALDSTAGKLMPLVICAAVLFLWHYSRKSAAQGIQV